MSGPWIVAFVALWAVVVLMTVLVLGMFRRVSGLIERTEESLRAAAIASYGGLPPGSAVPSFVAQTIDGVVFTESDLSGYTTVILFVSSACGTCEGLVTELQRADPPDIGTPLIVVSDEAEWAQRPRIRAQDVQVLVDKQGVMARTFGARDVPRAFVIDELRTVRANGRPQNWDGLRRLLEAATNDGVHPAEITAASV